MSRITLSSGDLAALKPDAAVVPVRLNLTTGDVHCSAWLEELERELPSTCFIRTALPRSGDPEFLESGIRLFCQASLDLAAREDVHTVAFPLLSSAGSVQRAWKLELETCWEWLNAHPDRDLEVIFLVPDRESLEAGEREQDRPVSREGEETGSPGVPAAPDEICSPHAEAALERLTAEEDGDVRPVLEALRRDMLEGHSLLIPFVQEGNIVQTGGNAPRNADPSQYSMVCLSREAGGDWIPCYTSGGKLPQVAFDIFRIRIDAVLDMAVRSEQYAGLILNSEDDYFLLDRQTLAGFLADSPGGGE